ncbi:MAG: AlkA N-terminal domain-containing protein [Pseudomonadota bacterium]
MELTHEACYRALVARDRRFDGRFFTGVRTTGVYCRPVCPARTPAARNCEFFACAAAAEAAGYRACRRCRPETAPGTPAWSGTSATVARALRLIDDGALDRGGVEALAARLGVGDRHLRHLFADQLGAAPLAVAQTCRAHFAKRLIEESEISMAQVAAAAGFQNVRRFNAAVQASFARTPTEIRALARGATARTTSGAITLLLPVRAPFDAGSMLAWFRAHAVPGVEDVQADRYRRTVALGDFVGVLDLSFARDPALRVALPVAAAPHLGRVVERVRALFDLESDSDAIAAHLGASPVLGALVGLRPGVRVPGCWDRFEGAVRAVLGQQVSVAAAATLIGRVAARCGQRLPGPGPLQVLFPRPEELAGDSLEGVGLPATRARTLQVLARAVLAGEPILELAPDLETAVRRLRALPGIGDWTAQVIAMHVLREPDAFPAGDLALRRALAGPDGTLPSAAELTAQAEAWHPWRAYAAHLLWRRPSPPLE